MTTKAILATLILGSLLPQSAGAQVHTDRGAVLGGLTGALAGAGVGKHNGDTAVGALIGGAVGVMTGAVIGNSIDQEQARNHAYQQQRLQALARGVSLIDIVTMTRNGVSDEIIINHIRQNGVQQRVEVSDVISLHRQGVSEAVISATQTAQFAGSASPPSRYAPPVIVEEHHYVSPRPVYWSPRAPYRYHHHHHYRPRRSGFHWGVSIGH